MERSAAKFANAARPLLLDGGLATQLAAQGNDLSDDLWSARLLHDDPDQIRRAHLEFFRAGAQVAITASYQASFAGFARRGYDRGAAARLLRRSVALAQQARADAEPSGPAFVAASIGPYGATLADGSEYRGRYGLSVAQLMEFHRPRLEVLAEAAPDLLAIETIPDCDEAAAILTCLADLELPAWLSFTVTDGCTAAGQSLREAFAMANSEPGVIAVGLNCSAPAEVGPALAVLNKVSTKPAVVYPNSGERWDAQRRCWTGVGGLPPDLVRSWLGYDLACVGGCCRTTPADIQALQAAIEQFPLHQT